MSPVQESSIDMSHKVTALRELLQTPSNRPRVAPLVTALMARDVDIHGRMLADLRDRIHQMEESCPDDSQHAEQISERIREIEQDAKGLRQLIQGENQRELEARMNHDQLKTELTEAIKQISAQMATVGDHFQILKDVIEGQVQTANGMKEALDTAGQRMIDVQIGMKDLKNGLENTAFATPIMELITKLEEKVVGCIDQSTKDADAIRHSLETIAAKPEYDGTPTNQCAMKDALHKPPSDDHAPALSPANQEKPRSKRPKLQDWPAIAEFLATYEHFVGVYKSQKINDEFEFIETFFGEINVHVSCALQRHLLDIYTKKVTLVSLDAGQRPPSIFINLSKTKWDDIRRAIPKIRDLRSLQWAFDNRISGPIQTTVLQEATEKTTGVTGPLCIGKSSSARYNPKARRESSTSGYLKPEMAASR
ncbi:hypothetical protein F4777DRAFT_63674 [Nemania sp. FL0916]|nr:hypothetical protein F4777DRAFT_63674 [Nemania sp. FL0916]